MLTLVGKDFLPYNILWVAVNDHLGLTSFFFIFSANCQYL